jgi:hypothetical protein
MNRIIVDFEKLTTHILDLLLEKYPDGYDHSDIISFKNVKGETIKAIEVKAEETIYLVKISSRLDKTIENYFEDEDSFNVDLEDKI